MEKTSTLEDFAYDLPENLIAQEPVEIRDESRMLKLDRHSQKVSHHKFKDIVQCLGTGDVVVVNDTRVIPARFYTHRESGGLVQVLLIKPEATRPGLWQAMASRLRRLRVGEILTTSGTERRYEAKVVDIVSGANGQKRLILDLGSQDDTFELLREIGFAPLPPYIRRGAPQPNIEETNNPEEDDTTSFDFSLLDQETRTKDLNRYQTIFAYNPGAVAAPTAGLHFTEEILKAFQEKQVEFCKITLHVGPGTFKPIADSVENHNVEAESYWVPEETANVINRAKRESRKIIAVGTTTCRALESSFQGGAVQAIFNQSTSLYIKPGFKFQVIDGLVTNFHLSKSSLLVLVAAFAGRDAVMNAYKVAIESKYRFYSYGDAMLII
jgi:S-adenosylmethionine:tRNA ribosyltransferase-isomerase